MPNQFIDRDIKRRWRKDGTDLFYTFTETELLIEYPDGTSKRWNYETDSRNLQSVITINGRSFNVRLHLQHKTPGLIIVNSKGENECFTPDPILPKEVVFDPWTKAVQSRSKIIFTNPADPHQSIVVDPEKYWEVKDRVD